MRRMILVFAGVALVLTAVVGAAPASGVPEPKGCPAAESGWMLTDFDGAYDFQLALASEAGYSEADIAALWGMTVKDLRAAYLSGYEYADRNEDGHLCIMRPQGTLGIWSPWMTMVVDNNAKAVPPEE